MRRGLKSPPYAIAVCKARVGVRGRSGGPQRGRPTSSQAYNGLVWGGGYGHPPSYTSPIAPSSGLSRVVWRRAARRITMALVDDRPLSELMEEYLAELEGLRDFSPHTLRAYRGELEAFIAYLSAFGAPVTLGRFVALELRIYLTQRRQAGELDATLARRRSALGSLGRWLVKRGFLAGHPAQLR